MAARRVPLATRLDEFLALPLVRARACEWRGELAEYMKNYSQRSVIAQVGVRIDEMIHAGLSAAEIEQVANIPEEYIASRSKVGKRPRARIPRVRADDNVTPEEFAQIAQLTQVRAEDQLLADIREACDEVLARPDPR